MILSTDFTGEIETSLVETDEQPSFINLQSSTFGPGMYLLCAQFEFSTFRL